MEGIATRLGDLFEQGLFNTTNVPLRQDSYSLDEECDNYGFSCLCMEPSHDQCMKLNPSNCSSSSVSITNMFQSDENWNNPGAVELMMKTYQLDVNPFSAISLSAIATGKRPSVQDLNYVEIKSLQYRAIAGKKIEEGMVLLQKSKIALAIQALTEAIKLDPDNVNGFFLRAKAYMSLMDFSNAKDDIESALKLTPNSGALLDFHAEIVSKTQGSVSLLPQKRKLVQEVGKHRGFNDQYDYIPAQNVETIGRLEACLKNNRNQSSSSSSSDNSSSSDDGSDRSQVKKKSKRSHKKSSKHRKHKHQKSSKKSKHKKHKKDIDR
jgi:tetratricopeptide (TPR) repeat protein